MSSEPKPELKVAKVTYLVPVAVLGTDAQGRTLVACPQCHEPAVVLENGDIVCPLGKAINDLLKREIKATLNDTPSPPEPEPPTAPR